MKVSILPPHSPTALEIQLYVFRYAFVEEDDFEKEHECSSGEYHETVIFS